MSTHPIPSGLPPSVQVESAAEARAALQCAAGRGLVLLSAPGAAGFMGVGWWRALVSAAAHPGPDALCCGAAPGDALAALRAGCRIVVLDGACPAFGTVAGAATQAGALLLPARPPALILRDLDLRRPASRNRLVEWLHPPA